MDKIIPNCCPRCNSKKLYKYGKDRFGNQKYQCPICKHQFAPDSPKKVNPRKYPSCPVCGKSAFLHHDYDDYSNYRCSDKKCNHSFFQAKSIVKLPPSMSNIIGKDNFKRMRHSLHLVITTLTLFYIGGTSFRKITTMLEILYNIKVSHVTVSDWCKKFAPIFHSKMLTLMPLMNFDSDEWHADETVVKILGKKYYIWFIIDSETRFVLGFHLSPHRDSPQAFSLFDTLPIFIIILQRLFSFQYISCTLLHIGHIYKPVFENILFPAALFMSNIVIFKRNNVIERIIRFKYNEITERMVFVILKFIRRRFTCMIFR